jgi:signal peptidase II
VIIAVDQLTKWMAESNLVEGQPIPIMPHLNMTLAYNKGAAFGFLANHEGWQVWLFAALALIVSVVIVRWLKKLPSDRPWVASALALILGGAVGNFIDRILHGKVVDFIDVYFDIPFWVQNYHFATFNVADIAITVGAAMMIFIGLFASQQLDN